MKYLQGKEQGYLAGYIVSANTVEFFRKWSKIERPEVLTGILIWQL